MVFNYYHRLSAAHKKIYRRSDAIATVPLPACDAYGLHCGALRTALSAAHRRRVWDSCQALCDCVTAKLEIPRAVIVVLEQRPADEDGELYGFYKPRDERDSAMISVWMRTARRRQVVAFKTFLRTLLHEMCHHIDYEYLQLGESFHTQGFYRRESSLFHQLVRPVVVQ